MLEAWHMIIRRILGFWGYPRSVWISKGPKSKGALPTILDPSSASLLLFHDPWAGPLYRWMVYFMKNPMNMDDDWEYPYFRKSPYISEFLFRVLASLSHEIR
jgi:hypothetical protein